MCPFQCTLTLKAMLLPMCLWTFSHVPLPLCLRLCSLALSPCPFICPCALDSVRLLLFPYPNAPVPSSCSLAPVSLPMGFGPCALTSVSYSLPLSPFPLPLYHCLCDIAPLSLPLCSCVLTHLPLLLYSCRHVLAPLPLSPAMCICVCDLTYPCNLTHVP